MWRLWRAPVERSGQESLDAGGFGALVRCCAAVQQEISLKRDTRILILLLSSQISPKKVRLAESPLRKVCPLSLLLSLSSLFFSPSPCFALNFLSSLATCISAHERLILRVSRRSRTATGSDARDAVDAEMHDCGTDRRARSTWAHPIHKPFMNAALRPVNRDQSFPSAGMNHNICAACVEITNVWHQTDQDLTKCHLNKLDYFMPFLILVKYGQDLFLSSDAKYSVFFFLFRYCQHVRFSNRIENWVHFELNYTRSVFNFRNFQKL